MKIQIYKMSNYLSDLLFGIESEESNDEQNNIENIDENCIEISDKDNNISDEESKINLEESSDKDEDDLSFIPDEFEPKCKNVFITTFNTIFIYIFYIILFII